MSETDNKLDKEEFKGKCINPYEWKGLLPRKTMKLEQAAADVQALTKLYKWRDHIKTRIRCANIMEDMVRYHHSLMQIPIEWLEEYNELIEEINKYMKQ